MLPKLRTRPRPGADRIGIQWVVGERCANQSVKKAHGPWFDRFAPVIARSCWTPRAAAEGRFRHLAQGKVFAGNGPAGRARPQLLTGSQLHLL
jgi:hypothetical protein